jgi:choline dehydrogenase-like flavoprotein
MEYLRDEKDPSWPDFTGGGWHHMGTTRMSNDPASGVVDKNCKVHGLANLYIAGSSCFTTAGAANPTLSLVALSLRLAAHLRELT